MSYGGAAGGVAIAGAIENIVSGLHERRRSDQMFQFSRAQAEEQEMWRKTGYQTTVQDMIKAGLNPMMAVKGGALGAAPQGAAVTPAGMPHGGSGPGLTHSAVALAQVEQIRAQTENIKADTIGKMEIPDLLKAQTIAQGASAEQLRSSAEKLRAEIQHIIPAHARQLLASRDLDLSKVNLNTYERLQIQPLLRDLHIVERAIALLSMPKHVAESGKASTFYGQNIAPYIGDLSTFVNSAAAGIGGAAGLKYLLGGAGLKPKDSITFGKGRKYKYE